MNVTQISFPQQLMGIVVISVSMVLGCGGGSGPRLATVSGTVTLNGQPLPDALVSFYHGEDRPSHGTTDASGHYELEFTADRKGALIGENVVRITLATVSGEGVKPRKETIPIMYNSDSELTYEVKSGSNENANFDLKKSGGGGG
ncbi:carboxypeptidase-like regulatory domain-containing protein [Blastopirellula marina]|uniref:Carboxypeptidase regulatory-like domain-containing protein n=1 Tax=Blastopirellula marina DSM 3645 TaxID=314230 RepID=A3ZRV5_9BACT|nr:carboxypeptidase-like regulatory domain-containing protein [Blastopirellula marina]EAQ80874.1 hypothetical protein DSM3645_12676 [Blastopirellula marina DSM 3645]